VIVHTARLLGLLLAVWLAASWTTERVSIHPRHWSIGPSPAQRGWDYADVSFRDSAGLTLRGWWVPGTRHRTVVMIHGWTASRQEPMSKAGYLHDAGYNLLLFDLRGHGASDGGYTTLGWAEPDDVASAVRFARGLDAGPIALFGYSMGASVAIEAGAREKNVRAVIEDSGYASLTEVIRARFSRLTGLSSDPLVYPLLAIGQADLGFDPVLVRPVDDAARLEKPLLVIVGTADTVVPPGQGLAIFRAAPGPKQLLLIPGAGHVAGYYREPALYRETVLDFLASQLN
jgi:pimeloyl-ACP methyl ester carboxylesterase